MSILEAIMLLCFGAAWPLSIRRSYKSRTTNGKSLGFLLVLILGYIAGIANKFIYNYDFVVYLYMLNLTMVSIDACLWIRNKKIENASK